MARIGMPSTQLEFDIERKLKLPWIERLGLVCEPAYRDHSRPLEFAGFPSSPSEPHMCRPTIRLVVSSLRTVRERPTT